MPFPPQSPGRNVRPPQPSLLGATAERAGRRVAAPSRKAVKGRSASVRFALGRGVVEESLDALPGAIHQLRRSVGPRVGAPPGVGVGRRQIRLCGVEDGAWFLRGGRAVRIDQLRVAGDDGKLLSQLLLPAGQLVQFVAEFLVEHRGQSRTSGAPASRQATMPPDRLRTSGWPMRVSSVA